MLTAIVIPQRGEGLIEALITAVIIIISIVALISFQINLAYNDGVVQQRGEATTLAQKQIETLRDYHVYSTQSPYKAYSDIATGSSSYVGTTATYTISWTVTTNASPSYKTLNVTVTWTDRRGVSQSVNLTSIVAGITPSTSASVMYH